MKFPQFSPWRSRLSIVLPLILLGFSSATHADEGKAARWTPIFNGKNFDGWYVFIEGLQKGQDPEKIFQAQDGVIHVYHDQKDGSEPARGYLSTNAQYSQYRLRFQYKWGTKRFVPRTETKRDAGVLYHVFGPDRLWPSGVECQVQEQDTGDCITVLGPELTTTVDPHPQQDGLTHYLDSTKGGVPATIGGMGVARIVKDNTAEVEGWNTVEILVRGSEEVEHKVNGQVVFRAHDLRRASYNTPVRALLDAGRIIFQAEYAEVMYRNIEIQPLASGNAVRSLDSLQLDAKFEIQQIAGPPLVNYPMLACYDDLGRLYVSDSEGDNSDNFERMLKNPARSIRRLEDIDGDGTFDRFTVFADQLTYPYGGVWHKNVLYVASPPNVWRLEDTDDDGVADQRTAVVTGFRSYGYASDMKGAYRGPDGWLYFCGGNEGGYDLRDASGTPALKDDASAPCVFRMSADCRNIEFVANGGAGIYDLCFDPSGDLLGLVTIAKRDPRGDGIVHWVYGGAYVTGRDLSRYARFTGDRLPLLRDWGQSSPSGLIRYESGALGEEYRGSLFSAHYGTHNVRRTVVEREGGTWRIVKDEDFLRSNDPHFFPSEVVEDADGSLIVMETGLWFARCPTAQVNTAFKKGAIYRIRGKDATAPLDARGLAIHFDDLPDSEIVRLLDDSRPIVVERAISTLASRGSAAVPSLRTASHHASPTVRRNAVWSLNRIDDAAARAGVRDAMSDEDTSVRLAAIHSIALWRDREALDGLIAALKAEQPAVLRSAATALGRLQDPAAVGPLAQALAVSVDRFVEHSVIYALIEIDARDPTLAALTSDNSRIRSGALVALDQMAHGNLQSREVLAQLTVGDPALTDIALGIISRHKEWSADVIDILSQRLSDWDSSAKQQAATANLLIAFIRDPQVQELIGKSLSAGDTSPTAQRSLLDVIARSGVSPLPATWRTALKQLVQKHSGEMLESAIAVLTTNIDDGVDDDLIALALDKARPLSARAAAAAAVVRHGTSPQDELVDILIARCLPQNEPVDRLQAARALAAAKLATPQLGRVVEMVANAGPLELPILLRTFDNCSDEAIGSRLVDALQASTSARSLPVRRIEELLAKYPEPVKAKAQPFLNSLNSSADVVSRDGRLQELQFALSGGNAIHGREVFFGRRAACSVCHRVEDNGGTIGPNLSQVGSIRTRRDLLEAIVFPSATIVRGFEPFAVTTTSAQVFTGVVIRETNDALWLGTADRGEVPIPRHEVDEMLPGHVSIMPEGLDRALQGDELRDLLAYLSSLTKANK